MAVAMGTSYMTQVVFFLAHHVGSASWAVPATIDVLALMSNLAIGLPRRKGYGRKGLWSILIVTLTFSMVINFMAGENFIASTAHVWVVAAYLAGEYVRGWVKGYRAALEDENEETTTAPQVAVTEFVADEAASPDLPTAPVSPAPRRTTYSERHERRLRTGR